MRDGSVLGRCRAVYGGGKINNDISDKIVIPRSKVVIDVLVIVVWYVSLRTPALSYSPSGTRNTDEKGDAAEFKRVV